MTLVKENYYMNSSTANKIMISNTLFEEKYFGIYKVLF